MTDTELDHYLPLPSDSCPTFVDDSEWTPLVDGVAYFSELADRLAELGAGDSLVIHGFEFNSRTDLRGWEPGDPGYLPLGERLARLAAEGVDVRVVLAGERVATILPIKALDGFRRNVRAARRLQRWIPRGSAGPPPLLGRVLLDKSGPVLGSNHVKSVAMIRQGVATAFVGGIDLTLDRFDRTPHDTLRMHGSRWGWHDAAVRLRGPAAARAHAVLAERWATNARRAVRRQRLMPFRGPRVDRSTAPVAGPQPVLDSPGTSVRVVRSTPPRRERFLTRRVPRVHEVFDTVTAALAAAQRYVYIEDQYLHEEAGGHHEYELYPYLRAAAARGVKVILVGSGARDPDDPGLHLRPINRSVNKDVQHKVLDELDADQRDNVVVYRVQRVTVHAKILLVDDVFACIGSANMFSRSMSGTDRELSTAVHTDTPLVRDLRVQLWAEHLRTDVSDELAPALRNLDIALGIWRPSWSAASDAYWQSPGEPPGFAPVDPALIAVPSRRRLPWRR